jgi:hypothetical protein
MLADSGAWIPVLPNQCILELKYPGVMPVILKNLIETLAVNSEAVSKYRLSVQAFGWVAEAKIVSMPTPSKDGLSSTTSQISGIGL